MSKKVRIGSRPTINKAADAWVESRVGEGAETEKTVKMKRLTIDIPEPLHRAIKSQCALRGTKIADEVREILQQKYRKS